MVVKSAVENVASMDQDACKEISEERGSWPYHLDPVHAVPMKRLRFAWVSESLEGVFPDISFHSKRYWTEVVATADYPNTEQWLEPEHDWAGERVGDLPHLYESNCQATSASTTSRDREV